MNGRKLWTALGLVSIFTIGLLAGRQIYLKGNTDATQNPENTQGYTLEDVFDRLDTGADGVQSTFTEPVVAKGTATMRTLNEIMALIPDRKWSFTGADGDRVLTIPDGIYEAGRTATVVDSDLSEENIRLGFFSIFGVWGENEACVVCEGTLSAKGRWCDNGDGTVTDMTTGLTWLKAADWGGSYPWRNDTTDWPDMYTDARGRPAELDPPDGTEPNYWRLPTRTELQDLYLSPEGARVTSPYFFTGIQEVVYWASSCASSLIDAYGADFGTGGQPLILTYIKSELHNVWPVRGRRR